MKNMEKLRGAVGRLVSAVVIRIQFYGVETKGDLVGVVIDFADGARSWLSCAGDGSIFVAKFRDDKGDAPGFITVSRSLEGVCGELSGISVQPQALQLRIGKRELLVVNDDDELYLTIDNSALPQELLGR